jgi:hypothetical protein
MTSVIGLGTILGRLDARGVPLIASCSQPARRVMHPTAAAAAIRDN